METIEVDNKTANLLAAKGLKCVCQLCDCGRFHKHTGCKVQPPTVAATFGEGRSEKIQSDYTARFPAYDAKPAQAIYQRDEIQRPSKPQPMDLETVNQLSYQTFNNPQPRKPCKLKGEIDKLMSGEFNDQTNYKDSYVGYTAPKTKTTRPPTVFKGEQTTFATESEYMNGYQKKVKVHQEKIAEKPTHTYGLLYPDSTFLPKTSLKNLIHDGRQGEKTKSCEMRKPNIDFGLHGEFDHTTTNGVHFKDYDVKQRTLPNNKSDQKYLKTKFEAISQNQVDFQYDAGIASAARGKKITEHPSLIQLSMEVPHDFKTVSNLSYHNWKSENFKRPKAENKGMSTYAPPKVKFDADSHTHRDYISYGATPRTERYNPPEFRKSSAKVSGETNYSACFQNYGKVERKFYGEYHSPNLQLPAKDEKFDATSIMRYDYKPIKSVKREPFKPSCTQHTSDERLQTATEYNEKFLPTQNKPCQFSKYIAEQKAAKLTGANVVTVP